MDEYEGMRRFGRKMSEFAGAAAKELDHVRNRKGSHTMTGIERLRGVAGFWRENKLDDIVEQIEREQGGRVSRMRVLSVVTEMERHVSGVEGAEDSPVARWARELREALGGDGRDPAADVSVSAYDLLPQEDRDAIAWVREHGGLERVKAQRFESMPRAAYERKKAGFLGHIAECETALGRRREIISELNHRASDLTRENAELRKRAMPEGYEWPRFESGEPVMLGDSVVKYVGGGEFEVRSIEFRDGAAYLREGFRTEGIVIVRPGERVKRPAPKVLDADGVEIRRGDTVYEIETGERYFVTNVFDGMTEPDFPEHTVVCRKYEDVVTHMFRPSQLTHTKPEPPDSWERIEKDAKKGSCDYFGCGANGCHGCPAYDWNRFRGGSGCGNAKTYDIVRRAKTLAGDE